MIAQTPPMGWNSWNTFGGNIHEDLIRETADAFIREGLKDAGYEYVVIDDIWEADARVDGRLTWDTAKFPHGIPALADYVHSKGLKFGIYSCAGSHTCAGMPASYGYEEVDAQTFAAWGVDFLKYDFCFAPAGVDGPKLYQRMGQALRATGREILFSICEWGSHKPWEWGAKAGGHIWRTTGDINDSWESIVDIGFNRQAGLEAYAGPGHWNDPDMLVVGMYGKGNVAHGGCTNAEYRSHFSLWCLLASPLMLGCDVRAMSQATRDIVLNRAVIAVNQDPFGRQGYRVGKTDWAWEIVETWAKPLHDGSIAVGLFNLGERNARRATVAWEAVGLHDRRPCQVCNLWTGEDLGVFTGDFSTLIDSHDVALVKLTPLV
ncbi:MAG TPA: glycoside hydrolase family 27 protein [Anaerolineae bacterium]|nr:glycoside hydrolase family 27 protein [Anaerolineae bacterium]HQI82964.1 glycoside hydrolase family 27 protein [Anaerolineae bacterium]